MTLRRLVKLLWVAVGLACVGLLVYHVLHPVGHAREAAYARDLRQLGAVDARLGEDLLRSRSGLAGNYDALVAGVADSWRLCRALRELPPSSSGAEGSFLAGLADAEATLTRKEAALERFKTLHSALRNSRTALPVLMQRLAARAMASPDAAPLTRAIAQLSTALLGLDLSQGDSPGTLGPELGALAAALPLAQEAGVEHDLRLMLRHARLLAETQRVVDGIVRQVLRSSLSARVAELAELQVQRYRAARAAAARRRGLLAALCSGCIMLGLCAVIIQLRRSGRQEHAANLRERELGELKTRFVAMTSHEFRTPLSTVLSSSQMLLAYAERWDAERRAIHLGRIIDAARSMRHMLEEILLIGRAEAGALLPSPAEIDLGRFCQNLVATHRDTVAGSHAIVTSYSGPPSVTVDERLLSHILGNLLGNALKYSDPDSEVTLDVVVDERECRFLVRDSGIGVPEAERARLFDSFYRASNVGTIPGSGLGLAVVKHAVTVQAGSIDLTSEAGKGSAFCVRLPRTPPPQRSPAMLGSLAG